MSAIARPLTLSTCALLVIGALLTGYFGLSAGGYLVPAACLALTAALLAADKAKPLIRAIAILNMAAGTVLVLVLAFGTPLGEHKLDVSGVALLTNLLFGGPLMSVAAPLMLLAVRPAKS